MPRLGESVAIPLVVISQDDDHLSTINTLLRDAGHAVHCSRVEDADGLREVLRTTAPELVLLFTSVDGLEPADAVAVLEQGPPPAPPLLVVDEAADEAAIAAAMAAGARDLVTLGNRARLIAVASRELAAQRLRLALEGVVSSAHEYKQELRKLMKGASEAIADVHEGIVVAANPAWMELLGLEAEDQLVGQPFMDLFSGSDQPGIKGALVACLRNKWQGGLLHVSARRADGSALPMDLRLESATIDGEAAVRVIVQAGRSAEQSPQEMLEEAVARDPSTRLWQRQYFIEMASERLAQPLPGGVRCVAYLRPDEFARVNQNVGLLESEDLLAQLADLMREFMLPNDVYGRFGGTMFAAVLERGTMTDVSAWAEQVCKAVAGHVFGTGEHSTNLSCTIGICEAQGERESLASLLAEAESACRRGREAGGNRLQLSAQGTQSLRLRQLDEMWLPRLRAALMHNRLRLVHQPVVSLNDDLQGALDTRIRLHDEEGQVVLPGEFLPPAERAGMMKNIDRWVIGASLSFCAARRPPLLFIRLSRDSVVDPSIADWLRARAAQANVRPGQVCLQVSEDIVAQQLRETSELSSKLRRLGFLFAVDHLGIGRDSAQLLQHVPMHYLKIDGSLMQGLHKDPDVQQRVREIVEEARRLGIRTIAERVESANTIAVLWQLGVGYVQGNFNTTQDVVLEDLTLVEQVAV
ncbi:MAG: EAL domain-containing protein [Chromatiales bacterium]|nr:EAL domain-containing protein [Chromatiales bacterium]